MVKNKQLVSTGIILSLLASNLIIGKQYIEDSKKYEQKISQKSKIISQNEAKLTVLSEKSVKNEQKLADFSNKIDLLTVELDKVKKENQDLTKENNQIKKEYNERKDVNKKRQLNMELTFYVSDCRGCSGITKTGVNVKNSIYYKNMRIIATDPKIIPLHSIVKIETDKESYIAYAADTGGAIKGNILDVLVSSEKEAFKLGRQKATVTVIREGKR
jgi:3D (Asp-Asp-Asp) domain-containing protein